MREDRRLVIEAALRDRCDSDVGRLAIRRRHDLRLPHAVLLICALADGDFARVARGIAARIARAVSVEAVDDEPAHTAVVLPVINPTTWRYARHVAKQHAIGQRCLVVARPSVTGLRALRATYFRAVADAQLARAAGLIGPLLMPEDLVIPRMLGLLDGSDQETLLRPLRGIISMEPDARARYLKTLEVLLDSGGDLVVAARRLHLHVNSLRYRIHRIEEALGLDLTDPAKRMSCDLAVMLLRLRGFAPPHEDGDDFGLAVMDSA